MVKKFEHIMTRNEAYAKHNEIKEENKTEMFSLFMKT